MGNITYSDWMEDALRDAEDYHKLATACWNALGVTEYTGKHIAEHITEMKAELARLLEVLSKLHYDCMASDFNEHWDSYKAASEALAKHNKGSE